MEESRRRRDWRPRQVRGQTVFRGLVQITMSCDRVQHRTRWVRVSLIFHVSFACTEAHQELSDCACARAGNAEMLGARGFRIAVKPAAMPLRATRPQTFGHRETKSFPVPADACTHLSRCDHVVQHHRTRGRPITGRPRRSRVLCSASGSHTSTGD